MILAITKPYVVIAISMADHERYGCPYCGYVHAYQRVACSSSFYLECVRCEKHFIALGIGTTVSPIGFCPHFGAKDEYPVLQEHPRPVLARPGFFKNKSAYERR